MSFFANNRDGFFFQRLRLGNMNHLQPSSDSEQQGSVDSLPPNQSAAHASQATKRKETVEDIRLSESRDRTRHWQRWGPYLSERQWGTVREDYSGNGDCWNYFPHEHARSRAYRWGEDGLLGITDRECRLCFALALWNGKDPILKERLYGLNGPEVLLLFRFNADSFVYERVVQVSAKRISLSATD
jgi:hypothetical protein